MNKKLKEEEDIEKLFAVDNMSEPCPKCGKFGEVSHYRYGANFKSCRDCGYPKWGLSYDKWKKKWMKMTH